MLRCSLPPRMTALALLVAALTTGPASAAPIVTTERIAGIDRYETAAAISRATFVDGIAGNTVLARGDDFPDALAGSHLAGFYGPGSVLLTGRDSLHPAALAEIERRSGASTVFLVGDVEAISATVEADLLSRGFNVSRIGGPDRYNTARRVAGAAPDGGTVAFLTSGERFADAIAAGPFAYPVDGPYIYLTPSGSLHPETRLAIDERGTREIIIVGGTQAVSAAVEAELRSICYPTLPGSPCLAVLRIAGGDRAETATLLADHFAGQRGDPYTHVNLARGDTFPDALGGAPHGGTEDAPTLFTQSPTELGESTREWLAAHADEIESIHVFGDAEAVSDAVVEEARLAATAG